MADYARGQLLQDLRDRTHLSRENVAAEIGVTAKTLYTWEHGGKIKWENAKKLARYYKVDPETLVSRENGSEPVRADESDDQLGRIERKLDDALALLNLLADPDEAEEEVVRLAEEEAELREEPPGESGADEPESRPANQ